MNADNRKKVRDALVAIRANISDWQSLECANFLAIRKACTEALALLDGDDLEEKEVVLLRAYSAACDEQIERLHAQVTQLRRERDEAVAKLDALGQGPPTSYHSNGEAGDGQELCDVCGFEGGHSWQECALESARHATRDAERYWESAGQLHEAEKRRDEAVEWLRLLMNDRGSWSPRTPIADLVREYLDGAKPRLGSCGRAQCRGVSDQVNHDYCRDCASLVDGAKSRAR